MTVGKNRTLRVAAGIAILFAAAWGQYRLINVPRPIKLANEAITASRERSRLSVRAPAGEAEKLLTFVGNQESTLEVDVERAVVDPVTAAAFSVAPSPPPTGPASITYTTHDTSTRGQKRTCRASFVLTRADPARSITLKLYQQGESGSDRFRRICLRVSGTATKLDLKTNFEEGGSKNDTGCEKRLKVGAWSMPTGNLPIALSLLDGASCCMMFFPARADSPSIKNRESWFDRIELAEGANISEIAVEPYRSDSQPPKPHLLIRADGGHTLIPRLLRIGADTIELKIDADRAWVSRDGTPAGVNLLDQMQRNPLLSGVIGALNAGLLAWLRKRFFQRRQQAAAEAEPTPAA